MRNLLLGSALLLLGLSFSSCEKNELQTTESIDLASISYISPQDVYPRKPSSNEFYTLERDFPLLNIDNVMLVAAPTYKYNCIAYSMGLTNTWINPPSDELSLEVMYNHAKCLKGAYSNFKKVQRMSIDSRIDTYSKGGGPTHASAKTSYTDYSSKLGTDWLISHRRNELERGIYGNISMSFQPTDEFVCSVNDLQSERAALISEIAAWESSKIIEFSDEERNCIKIEAKSKLQYKDEFIKLFHKWKKNWLTNPATKRSNDSRVTKQLEEFPQLMALGSKIIPLILELLIEDPDENFILLVLYDELNNITNKIMYKKDDPAMFEGEQVRALRTVKLYLDNLKSES